MWSVVSGNDMGYFACICVADLWKSSLIYITFDMNRCARLRSIFFWRVKTTKRSSDLMCFLASIFLISHIISHIVVISYFIIGHLCAIFHLWFLISVLYIVSRCHNLMASTAPAHRESHSPCPMVFKSEFQCFFVSKTKLKLCKPINRKRPLAQFQKACRSTRGSTCEASLHQTLQ